MISTQKLKDAERVVRITMIVILLTAGSSKFFSNGAFFDYYSELFQGELRINLPSSMVDLFLLTVPFIELTLGLALLSNKYKNYTAYAWLGFMLSLMFGHYILQEWSAVNEILDYIFLGLLYLVLPAHSSWLARDRQDNPSTSTSI